METPVKLSKCKRGVTSNIEMQVHGKENTFTSNSEMLASSGLKRRRTTFKIILTLQSTLISYPACAFLLMVEQTVHAHYVFVKIKYSRTPLVPWDDLAWHGFCAHSWTLSLCRTGICIYIHSCSWSLARFVLGHAWKISQPNKKNPSSANNFTI